jgi:hypothetical protein
VPPGSALPVARIGSEPASLGETITAMVVWGLYRADARGRLALTDDGRAALRAGRPLRSPDPPAYRAGRCWARFWLRLVNPLIDDRHNVCRQLPHAQRAAAMQATLEFGDLPVGHGPGSRVDGLMHQRLAGGQLRRRRRSHCRSDGRGIGRWRCGYPRTSPRWRPA